MDFEREPAELLDLEAELAKARLLARVLGEPSRAAFALGRFDVLRCIGRGGMGQVYEARERATGTQLALKTLHGAHGDALGNPATTRDRAKHETNVRCTKSSTSPATVSGDDYALRAAILYSMQLDGSDFAELARLSEVDHGAYTANNFAIAEDGTFYVARLYTAKITRVSPDGAHAEDFVIGKPKS